MQKIIQTTCTLLRINKPPYSRYWLAQFLIFFTALIARLLFWWYTNWTIEDGMIIARMVRNLVEFGQFSFNIGERVSSSTSPLFGLLVASISYLGIPPLASAKIIGAIASSLTAVLIFRILYDIKIFPNETPLSDGLRLLSALSCSSVYIFLPSVIAYSVGGLETPVYSLLCAISLERLSKRKNPQAQNLAILFGTLACLFRPDGAIILVVVTLIILWDERKNLKPTLVRFIPVFFLILLYLLAHQIYFGVPVPQSLLAKASGYRIDILKNAGKYLNRMLFAQPGSILIYLLGFVGVVYSFRKKPGLLVFILWYLIYHLLFILRAPLFDWYLQVPLFVLCLFCGLGIFGFVEFFITVFRLKNSFSIFIPILGFSLGILLLVAMTFYAKGKQESYLYEISVRGAAGKWLSQNTSPTNLVFTESLGYVGFFSNNSFIDWPGLASPQVPDLLVRNGVQGNRQKAYDTIIFTYKPDFLVLRVEEWEKLASNIKEKYFVCENFPARSGVPYLIAGQVCPN